MNKVVATGKAWDAVGWDDGKFRIKDGKTTYDAIFYASGKRGQDLCRLAKLVPDGNWMRQINRYVGANTELEFLGSGPTSPIDYPKLKWV